LAKLLWPHHCVVKKLVTEVRYGTFVKHAKFIDLYQYNISYKTELLSVNHTHKKNITYPRVHSLLTNIGELYCDLDYVVHYQ